MARCEGIKDMSKCLVCPRPQCIFDKPEKKIHKYKRISKKQYNERLSKKICYARPIIRTEKFNWYTIDNVDDIIEFETTAAAAQWIMENHNPFDEQNEENKEKIRYGIQRSITRQAPYRNFIFSRNLDFLQNLNKPRTIRLNSKVDLQLLIE